MMLFLCNLLLFFFFQAEDGIRDLVRSRGLGDVYKRQCEETADAGKGFCRRRRDGALRQAGRQRPLRRDGPVSYTHLTLPTSDLV